VVDLSVHPSIEDIDEALWDDLLGEDGPPYLKWAFLRTLEHTECVHPRKGWMPAHLVLRQDETVIAAAPAYVKGNSEGEFVFDHSWAQFCHEKLGRDYYPKLVVSCPFTPAVGPRLLVAPGADRSTCFAAFAAGLSQFADAHDLSSAHVLFPDPDQAEQLQEAGLAMRHGVQFHWRNQGYATFDDFLSRYNSKRRHQIRRERREMQQQGLKLEVLSGSDLASDQIDHAYDFYRSTVHKYFWGRQYLNREFFHELCARLGRHVLVVFAYERGNPVPIAGAFNLLGGGKLYGRYWGATQERRFLHFNVCYYQGIEECIERGLSVFEPGAGGEHKIVRGFEPVITHSAHYLGEPVLDAAVRDFLRRERQAVQRQLEVERGPLKSCEG